jgi:VanZ family protein
MELISRKAWLFLAAAWAATIFELSAGPYSSAASARFLSTYRDWFCISILPRDLGLLNELLRKSAHLAEFAVLAVLLYNLLKPEENPFWSPRAANWALLLSGCYSITDEFHQYFVPGRHACLSDCVIDTTGAVLGLFVLSKVVAGVRRRYTDSWDRP